jgi:hypothetical protein
MDDDVVDLTASESFPQASICPAQPVRSSVDSQRRADELKLRIAEKQREVEAARERYRNLSKELKDLELSLDLLQTAASRQQTDWRGRFEWSEKVDALLKNPFALSTFRPLQIEIINAALAGRDVLVVLPTGGFLADFVPLNSHDSPCRMNVKIKSIACIIFRF